MSNAKEVLKRISKQYGEDVASEGVEFEDVGRIPTGIFPFDLATGGGFPFGRISIVYGPESSLKSTLAMLAIANVQKLHPNKKAVFVDVETSYDPKHASSLGVDNDQLILVQPDFAEQAVDIIEAFLYADDVSLVVVDSLAALITANEVESSAEKATPGGAGLVIGRLYRKATLAMAKARKEGRSPALIAINQIRFKIGVLHGDPEVMPGGMSFKFASSLTVRLYGKDIIEKQINPIMPCYKQCSGIIKKWKVPVFARTFEFQMATMNKPEEGLEIGKCNDWPTISSYAKNLGVLKKIDGGGWEFFGHKFKVLEEIKSRMSADYSYSNEIKAKLIELVRESNVVVEDAEGTL